MGSGGPSDGFHRGRVATMLLILGGWSAKVGGADMRTGALRVAFWSALAMAITALVGAIAGTLG